MHRDMVRRMRDLAEEIDGFVEWRDAYDGAWTTGVSSCSPRRTRRCRGRATRRTERSIRKARPPSTRRSPPRSSNWSAKRAGSGTGAPRSRMADEPLVDAHIHFWDKSAAQLEWAWLAPGYQFRKWTSHPSIDANAHDRRVPHRGCRHRPCRRPCTCTAPTRSTTRRSRPCGWSRSRR